MKRLLQITLAIFIMTGLTTVAFAQADIDATATVEANITVNAGNPLDFGTLAAGANSSVAVGDGTAGTFNIVGNGGPVELSFSFLNGGYLVGPGSDIEIIFDNNSATWDNNSSPVTSSNNFNPNDGATTSALSADSDNTIHVFIGGSINAAANQTAGNYEEEITLTATYN